MRAAAVSFYIIPLFLLTILLRAPARVVESGDLSPASDLLHIWGEAALASRQAGMHLFTPCFAVPLLLVPNRGAGGGSCKYSHIVFFCGFLQQLHALHISSRAEAF